MKNVKNHLAFTMIELIFVILVLGIVAAIGSSIIAKIYESYIYSRSINELQSKTELALTQISKFLSFRIKGSTIARIDDNNITSLLNADSHYKILEWIGYDNEGFKGNGSNPGWSGFVDLSSNETNKSQIKTSGSQLLLAEQSIYALSNSEVNISLSNSEAAIIFDGLPVDFNISQYGWKNIYNSSNTNRKHKYIFRVKKSGSDVLKFIKNKPSIAFEHYKLTWSAYAIVPEGNSGDKNLTFYYNYRPWMGKKYSDGNSSALLEHVSTFKFRQAGSTIRLKLCVFNPIGLDFNMTFCKEKVVF